MAFPGTYNFSYYRGDTYQFIVRPKNANGTVFTLDDYSDGALFTIANRRGSTGTQVVATATAVVVATVVATVVAKVIAA
jgi:hypothetical protein